MSNILDYLYWRGDISLKESKINEIDKIIFARVSYLPFEKIQKFEKKTLGELSKELQKVSEEYFLWPKDVDLIDKLKDSKRFKDIEISDFVEQFDSKSEMQFGACTIHLPNNEKYISFRGTDWSIVGWKEDFNLGFKDVIPSQVEAVNYLNRIAKKYRFSKLYVAGHSKGGNNAVYSAVFSNNSINNRILEIINIDGPGLSQDIINSENYKTIKDKIIVFIPQSSIVGRIFEYETPSFVIKSTEKGVLQHDVYSWEIELTKFIRADELTKESQMVYKGIREWLLATTPEEREIFVNVIYGILVDSNVESPDQIIKTLIKNRKQIMLEYKNVPEEKKEKIEKMFKKIVSIASGIIKEELIPKGLKSTRED